MTDISHTGTVIQLSAPKTFGSQPIQLTAFPKDVDPLDVSEVEVAEMEMGTNGSMVWWCQASPIEVTLALIPNTQDHTLLESLIANNRIEEGKVPNGDVIKLTRTMPNGEQLIFSDGKLTNGTIATSMQSSGRLKTVTYKFKFAKYEIVQTANSKEE